MNWLEIIGWAVAGFFIVGWSLGLAVNQKFRIKPTVVTVWIWWSSVIVILISGASVFHLLYLMPMAVFFPTIAMACLLTRSPRLMTVNNLGFVVLPFFIIIWGMIFHAHETNNYLAFIAVISATLFFSFNRMTKKDKRLWFFYDVRFFFQKFGVAAGLSEERIQQITPTSDESIQIIAEVFHTGGKPIDAAMVMADMCVRETVAKRSFFEANMDTIIIEAVKQGQSDDKDFLRTSLSEMMTTDVKDAEKLQFKAFEMGPQFGSMVALQEGKFKGRFDEFTEPV